MSPRSDSFFRFLLLSWFYLLFCFVFCFFFSKKKKALWLFLMDEIQLPQSYRATTRRLLACNFTKSSTPPRLFFTFLKFYKWHQIAQNTTIDCALSINGLKRGWRMRFTRFISVPRIELKFGSVITLDRRRQQMT